MAKVIQRILGGFLVLVLLACSHTKIAQVPNIDHFYSWEVTQKSLKTEYAELVAELGNRKLTGDQISANLRALDRVASVPQIFVAGQVVVPPRSKVTIPLSSYCLDLYKTEPFFKSGYQLKPIKESEIPLLKELLQYSEKNLQEMKKIQSIVWNIKNATPLDKYPSALRNILFKVNPDYKVIFEKYAVVQKQKRFVLDVLSKFSDLFEEHFAEKYIDFDTAKAGIQVASKSRISDGSTQSLSLSKIGPNLLAAYSPTDMHNGTLQLINSSESTKIFTPTEFLLVAQNSAEQDLGIFVSEKDLDRWLAEELLRFVDSSYDDTAISEKERHLIRLNPREALKVYYLANLADFYTIKHFHKSGTDDASDAYRHFMWAGMLTNDLGESKARTYLDAHEQLDGNDASTKMDRYNNEIGIETVSEAVKKQNTMGWAELEQIGLDKIRDHELLIAPKGR